MLRCLVALMTPTFCLHYGNSEPRAITGIIDDRETYEIGNVSGGIQSTTLFWASIFGVLPRPDAFIFADTGWERHRPSRDSKRSLSAKMCRSMWRITAMSANKPLNRATLIMSAKQCTTDFKIRPIRKLLRDTCR